MPVIGTFLGFFGVMKFVLDRAFIYAFDNLRCSLLQALKKEGGLTSEEQQRIITDTTSKLWDNALCQNEARNVTLWTRLGPTVSSLYNYIVPGPIRTLLFLPTYLITYPVRLFVAKKNMEGLRDRTREMAMMGLWSFLIPLSLGILTACVLVQEVEYVRIVNGQGPHSGDINKHIVKRVVIGPGRFSFSLPHHSIIYMVSYVIVLFAVFHTVSFFFILYSTFSTLKAGNGLS